MKLQLAATCIIMLLLAACQGPQYFVQKGDYDKAIAQYASNLRFQKKKQKKTDLMGLELAFSLAQRRDSTQLALLYAAGRDEHWPKINMLHRQIQTRQQKIVPLTPLGTRKGYKPSLPWMRNIDSLQTISRLKAASYLYAHAQALLAITDSSGQRQPARAAYYALRDLKTNYFSYWEQTNALIDSAYAAGKAHIVFEPSTASGVADGAVFWKNAALGPSFIDNEWLIFYADTAAVQTVDYRVKCKLVSLYVGSESNSSTERTETKQVEDGYDEVLDTAGRVISHTVKYKTETTTITTYSASRSANGTVYYELIDAHTGRTIGEQSITGSHDYSESSENFRPSAPSYWGMIGYVASSVNINLRNQLRKALILK